MIKKSLPFLALLLVSLGICFAQIIALSGKVSDEKTGAPIPGASIRVGKSAATSTNGLGEFYLVLNKADVLQIGIMVTSVAYQAKHVAYQDGSYHIKLQPATLVLHEVEILAPAESIMQKAIRKIPQNYPDKDFTMQGIIRIQELSKDSIGTYMYYKNDAAINMYYPSYKKTDDIEVSLIQNRFSRSKNPSKDIDSLRWLGGYLAERYHDFVHGRAAFVSLSGMKNFTYTNQGKGYMNNTRVYIINFFARHTSGTLYIDTASYAFVGATYTRSNFHWISYGTNGEATYTVNYKAMNGKWYIDNTKQVNTGNHNGFSLSYSFNYKTTVIDTTKAQPIAYHDKLQYMSENIKINKPGTDADWQQYKNLFERSEQDSMITSIPIPKIDTTPVKKSTSQKVLGGILGYLINDNIRYTLAISKMPLSVDGYQPVLSKNISPSAAYTLNFGMQFRLYKELFFQWDTESNFGIGGIHTESTGYLLTYNFEFNKQYHPITLSPVFGFNRITLTDHSTEYFNQKSLAYGLTLAYEVKQRLSYFMSVKYINPVNTYNAGLLLSSQQLYPSIGIVYKFK